jgi:hypothetical protein
VSFTGVFGHVGESFELKEKNVVGPHPHPRMLGKLREALQK